MKTLPSIAFALIVVAAVIQALRLFLRGRRREIVSAWILASAGVLLAAFTVQRSFVIGFPALTGTFESLLFYAWALCFLCFAYPFQKWLVFSGEVQFGATMAVLALLSVASSPLVPKGAEVPIQALRSLWLVAHVAMSFIGESFFVVSFVASIVFLASRDAEKRRDYDRISYTSVAVGYPVFTTGALLFGAIWAEQAWGAWWSWDPKETWALVTWLVYGLYLHLRLILGRRGAITAWVAIVGFLCTVFTFFGVNFLLPGLHSYG